MKKMFIAISALLLAITSCSDFLDSDIRSDFNYNNYFQTEKDLVTFANGMFGGLIT